MRLAQGSEHLLLPAPPPPGPALLTSSGCAQTLIWQTCTVKMAWERELCTFICVLAVVRDRAPCRRHWISWDGRRR